MRVNANQRKMLMAAGRFGIGPLASAGGASRKDFQEAPSAMAPISHTPAAVSRENRERPPGGGSAGSGSGGRRDKDARQQAWRKLHEDDGLDDVSVFLAAPKRRPGAMRTQASTPATASSMGAVAMNRWGGVDVGVRKAEEPEPFLPTPMEPKMELKMSMRQVFSKAVEEPESIPSAIPVSTVPRASASGRGARPKAASFKALTGPTVEDVRQLQLLCESSGHSSTVSPALQAAIDELHDEELRRAKRDEKRRREEWRKAHRREKQKKQPAPAKTQPEAEEDSKDDADESADESSSGEKRPRIGQDVSIAAKMDTEQRKFWAQKVKGCVSNDNKGFTDADLEKRLRAQEAQLASGKGQLMSEKQVLALMKGGSKEKVKDKVKKKEKTKDRSSRSRERRR